MFAILLSLLLHEEARHSLFPQTLELHDSQTKCCGVADEKRNTFAPVKQKKVVQEVGTAQGQHLHKGLFDQSPPLKTTLPCGTVICGDILIMSSIGQESTAMKRGIYLGSRRSIHTFRLRCSPREAGLSNNLWILKV